MAAWRRPIELSLGDSDLERLRMISAVANRACGSGRARAFLLGYWENSSFRAVGRALGLNHPTVQRCVERAAAEGAMAALDDLPRPGREPTITLEAKAWLTALSCRKAKGLVIPLICGHAPARALRSRARSRRRAPVPGQFGAGHVVQEPRSGRSRTRSATTWRSVILCLRRKMAEMRASMQSETAQESCGAVEAEAETAGWRLSPTMKSRGFRIALGQIRAASAAACRSVWC